MDFQNKAALVTGGGRGIGKAYAIALLERGVKVCIAELDETAGREAKEELSHQYGEDAVIFAETDVSSYESFERAVQETVSSFGRLDILINNAASFSEQHWEKMIQINVIGVIYGIKLAFKYMGKDAGHDGGHVINTASRQGLQPTCTTPVYSTSKFAVVGATKNFGSDYFHKTHGVKVNAVCPGAVDTNAFQTFPENSLDPVRAKKRKDSLVPISPSKVADAMIRLLEDGRNGALIRIYEDGIPQYLD